MLQWKQSTVNFLVLLLCLALSSCDDSKTPANTSKIDNGPVGTWKIDSEATLAANQAQISSELEAIPAPQQAEARAKLEDMFKSVEGTMEFKADKTLGATTILNGNEMVSQGTWEIDGDQVTTRTKNEDGEQIFTGSIKDGFLSLSPDQKQFVVLRRE